MLFLGLDIGTTHIKSVVIDENANIRSTYVLSNNTILDSSNEKVYSPEKIWVTIKEVIKHSLKDLNKDDLVALSVSSMAEAGVPIDAAGNSIYNIIPWNDVRALEEVEFVKKHLSNLEVYKKTGLRIHSKHPFFRLKWLQKHENHVFKRINKWLSIGDYAIYKLTGEYVTDYSLASRTMMFNINYKKWDKDLMELAGVSDIFPKVYEMGMEVSYIKKEIMHELGLKNPVKVILGAHDHLCAVMLSDLKGDEILDSMGTSEVFVSLTKNPILNAKFLDNGFNQGVFKDNEYYLMSSFPSSGASIEWLRNIVSINEKISYKDFLKGADETIRNSIIYIPYLNGRGTPKVEPSCKGSFINLSYGDNLQDLIKSIYEGISYQSKLILNCLEEVMKIKINKIKIVGGSCKNIEWMKTKSKISNRTMEILDLEEACAFGAAIIAAKAYNINIKSQITSKTVECFLDEESKNYYENKFKEYLNLIKLF